MATLAGGGFMFLMGVVAQRYMPKDPVTGQSEYGVFMALLNALPQLAIPALGLQTVFAQQAGAATSEERRRELAGTVRGVINVLFVLWLIVVVLAQIFEQQLLATYKIGNPTALWFTVDAALLAMIAPLFGGLLLGRQDFFWYGWISICNGLGRFLAVAILVVAFHSGAAGSMGGVLGALMVSCALFMWRTQTAWRGATTPIAWKSWLARVIPLTAGLGVFTFMLTRDSILAQRVLADSSGYQSARLVGVALVFLTAPLAAVLFPKVARSHALSEESNVLIQALGATGVIGALAAVASMLFPELPLRIMSGEKYINSAYLVPWFAWCMLPLAVANVLINNLLARERYAVVPWLLVVAVGYSIALSFVNDTPLRLVQTLGVFGVLLVLVCVVFTIRQPRAGVTRR